MSIKTGDYPFGKLIEAHPIVRSTAAWLLSSQLFERTRARGVFDYTVWCMRQLDNGDLTFREFDSEDRRRITMPNGRVAISLSLSCDYREFGLRRSYVSCRVHFADDTVLCRANVPGHAVEHALTTVLGDYASHGLSWYGKPGVYQMTFLLKERYISYSTEKLSLAMASMLFNALVLDSWAAAETNDLLSLVAMQCLTTQDNMHLPWTSRLADDLHKQIIGAGNRNKEWKG